MLVNQIAVFLENRLGRLYSLSKVLSDNKIDLVSLNIADTSDFGIVRMITSDNANATKVLKDAGFTVKSNDLIGIEVEDVPGGLTKVLSAMENEKIELEYLYSFARTEDKKAVILFRTSDTNKALEILKSHNI